MAKAQPLRSCVGCRERKAQHLMQRFVRQGQDWLPDASKRRDGRGAYLCSHKCAERVLKNKRYPGLASAALKNVYNTNEP